MSNLKDLSKLRQTVLKFRNSTKHAVAYNNPDSNRFEPKKKVSHSFFYCIFVPVEGGK